MEDLEYIDSYFTGPKPEDEKSKFEKRILEDSEFAEQVAFYISSNSAVKSQLEDERKQRFRELYDQQKVVPLQKRPIKMMVRYLAAACVVAVVLFLSGLLFSNEKTSAPQLADNYIKKEFNELGVTMGGQADSMQKGLALYNEGKWKEALPVFEGLMTSDTTNDVAKKYAGITDLRLGKYDEALAIFTSLAAKPGFSNSAALYEAVTLMKRNSTGDVESAKKILRNIRDNNLEGKATAVEWLKKLE